MLNAQETARLKVLQAKPVAERTAAEAQELAKLQTKESS